MGGTEGNMQERRERGRRGREEGGGEEGEGKRKGKGMEEVDTGEDPQGRIIGGETYERRRKVTERKQTKGKRHRGEKEENIQRRRDRGEETEM
jgi:hypothetical protein